MQHQQPKGTKTEVTSEFLLCLQFNSFCSAPRKPDRASESTQWVQTESRELLQNVKRSGQGIDYFFTPGIDSGSTSCMYEYWNVWVDRRDLC